MLTMKKIVSLFLSLLLAVSLTAGNKTYYIQSPDSRIRVQVEVGEKITYSVQYNGKELVSPSPVSLTVNGKTLGWNARVKKDKVVPVDEVVTPVVKTKSASVRNHYNELILTFSDPFGLVFRVFNEGVAYRFTTGFNGEITVD